MSANVRRAARVLRPLVQHPLLRLAMLAFAGVAIGVLLPGMVAAQTSTAIAQTTSTIQQVITVLGWIMVLGGLILILMGGFGVKEGRGGWSVVAVGVIIIIIGFNVTKFTSGSSFTSIFGGS